MCGFETMPGTIPAANMHYDHVAREILDSPYGTAGSLPSGIVAGEVHSYNYTYTIPETWRYEKLHFIGLIIDMATGEILNANNVISGYVGIKEKKQDQNIRVYPNPANNRVYLEGCKNADISVFSLTGQKVLSVNGFTGNFVDVSSLENGFYTVQIIMEDHSKITKKITILR
jgi:hypothetical protein